MGVFQEYLYPRQVVLVCASSPDKANVTAVEWVMPVSEKPPTLTLDLICTSMEFVVAVPTEKMREAVLLCGTTSGKFIDKFEEAHLTQARAKKVSAPLVQEAYANLECKVLSYNNAGDHTLVVGEVLEEHPPSEGREDEPLVFNRGGKKLFPFPAQVPQKQE